MLAEQCLRLKNIRLVNCVNLTDEGMVVLAGACSGLRQVNLSGFPLVANASIVTSILIRILKVRFTHFGFVLRSFNFPPSGWTKLKVRKTESEQTHHPGATVVHGYVK